MRKSIIIGLAIVLCGVFAQAEKACCATPAKPEEAPCSQEKKQPANTPAIEKILSEMNTATQKLNSCQTDISYLVIQDPELLDSKTLQNGVLYFQKSEKESKLRIRFDDLKQDDFDPVKQTEEYLFDGVWLTRINYKLEQVDIVQQAPTDKPIGVFELINHNFPLIGFSDINDIQDDFDISLAPETGDPNESPCLLLNVKEDSEFKKDYSKVNIWVYKDLFLPEKVIAYTLQGDEYHIQFKYVNLNKKLENAVFEVETPANFRKNIQPLETKPQ